MPSNCVFLSFGWRRAIDPGIGRAPVNDQDQLITTANGDRNVEPDRKILTRLVEDPADGILCHQPIEVHSSTRDVNAGPEGGGAIGVVQNL